MAGHSKWANIQHRKGKQDKLRAKAFTKVGREIIVAAKLGGGDPDMNPRLRLAISKAKAVNMPNDRIKKAIETGAGGSDTSNYEEVRYEGYGPGGVAIIVDALTDNRNRTFAVVRTAFAKFNGSLGESGSVGFMFDRVGQIMYPADKASNDDMFEAAVMAGAENCESDDDYHIITTGLEDLAAVRDTLEAKYGEAEKAELTWKPNTMAELDEEKAGSTIKMIDALEDDDDVQTVTTNMDVDDEILEKLMMAE
ncbi:MAG: YebC/PmpR family DNA-binding transcriptional regulator [Alphaproteobacteria bacterium]|nr:YebC/PmpR family DNA-binding transcriptional regulator [Alphaproteobacteria bacterium]NCQ87966.1 YebC/PmpR family DNA-binding transcriptional regulator [Alphaproteobacteria bacterium]NCT05527.1 YebC/PmpR family DNA-binding transcriptional regulator [Alphaproteobacteria bacterium]